MRRLLAAIIASLTFGTAVVSYAGITAEQIHSRPPATFVYDVQVFQVRTLTASRSGGLLWKTPMPIFVDAVECVSRLKSGTITAFTAAFNYVSTAGVTRPIAAAIDMYANGLADVGTVKSGTLAPPYVYVPSGALISLDLVITGTDTPTATDTSCDIRYHTPVGDETGHH